jgi:hypothetical protein
MYSSIQQRPMPISILFRWAGRASGSLLFVVWFAFVVQEAMQSGAPFVATIYQGIAFALVFAGYALGLRYELIGGILAILGTIAFFAVVAITTQILPQAEAAWFAVPGLLYLLAWHYDHLHRRHLVGQP